MCPEVKLSAYRQENWKQFEPLFKLVKLMPIVSVSNKNFELCNVDNFLPRNPLGLIIHCLYISCDDTFFNQLYVAMSDRILRTVFVVVKNGKKRADCDFS